MSAMPTTWADAVSRWRAIGRERAAEQADGAGRRVVLVASYTPNPIAPVLGVALAEREPDRMVPDILVADYNQLFQLCADPAGNGIAADDDVVFLWRIEDVFERDLLAWAEGAAGASGRLSDGVAMLADAIVGFAAAHAGGVVVADPPTPVGFGLDHRDPAELAELAALRHELSATFDARLDGAAVDRLAVSALQLAHGSLAWFDRRNWVMQRNPHTSEAALAIGLGIADVIVRRTQAAPKVLVLDCDDTLWGGVVVDDGIGALQASDTFPGFAYRSFQIAARRLRHRGVLLALASKNDDENVRRAFAEVDGMALTDDDIAGRRVSWEPKPDGIASLAAEFNLGLDSFVFVDDSDYEVGSVRTQLPVVRVLQVPEDIEELPDLLAESGWFRGLRVTDDDRERTVRMQAESERTHAASAMTHEEFLANLDLVVRVARAGDADLGRVVQLINKTNQFNLTTRRRADAEVASIVADADHEVFVTHVEDRFGTYGLIGVVIARVGAGADADVAELDSVLMSCRVLGRGVETAMLAAAVDALRARGVGDVVGRYVPTDRNAMVAELLPEHGFEPEAQAQSASGIEGRGEQAFRLPAGKRIDIPTHVQLEAPAEHS